jgi:ADP-ribose pyrophosphatase YjhB (NUDIX family)
VKLELRVAALFARNGNLLVQYKVDVPEAERVYALVGGHLKTGERFADALRREFEEELGLAVEAGDLVRVHENFWHEGERYRNARGEWIEPRAVHEIGFYLAARPADPAAWPDVPGDLPTREPHIGIALVPLEEALARLQPEAIRDVVRGHGLV